MANQDYDTIQPGTLELWSRPSDITPSERHLSRMLEQHRAKVGWKYIREEVNTAAS